MAKLLLSLRMSRPIEEINQFTWEASLVCCGYDLNLWLNYVKDNTIQTACKPQIHKRTQYGQNSWSCLRPRRCKNSVHSYGNKFRLTKFDLWTEHTFIRRPLLRRINGGESRHHKQVKCLHLPVMVYTCLSRHADSSLIELWGHENSVYKCPHELRSLVICRNRASAAKWVCSE